MKTPVLSNILSLRFLILFFCLLGLQPNGLHAKQGDKKDTGHKFPLQVYGILEFTVHEYNNLLLLPKDYYTFGGVGVSKLFLYSGNEFALGALAEIKFGRCLTLDRVYAFDMPFYLTANYGALADMASEQKFGFSVGLGMDYCYSYYASIREEHDKFFRPAFFVQTGLNMFNKPVIVRYSTLLTPDKVTQTNFLFGMYLVI